MRETVQQIDNERDFHGYMISHANNVPSAAPDIAYKQHPVRHLYQRVAQIQS